MKKESYLIRCLRRLRGHREGIILADQAISSLKDVVKSNVYTIVALSQSSQKDRREVISILGLNSQQVDITNRLAEGEGIVRLAARFPYPLLLKFPLVKSEYISDAEIDMINRESPIIQGLLKKVKHVYPKEDRKDETGNTATPPKKNRTMDLILDIYNRFDISSVQRAKDLGLSASAADKIYKHLEREQLSESFTLNLTGKKGGLSKYHSLTKKGLEFSNKPAIKQSGGTGLLHFFICRYLKKHLPEKGFTKLEIEKNIEGKRIDLYGSYKEISVGMEVCCTTMKTEHINIIKNDGKCDCLLILAPDKKIKVKLEKEVNKNISSGTQYKICLVSELLNNPDEIIRGS